MTWVQRVGNIVSNLALVGLEVVGLFTEGVKIVAEHVDGIVDDLQGRLTTGSPPAS